MVEPRFRWKNNQDIAAANQRLAELGRVTEQNMEQAMEECTLRIMADARRNCPVDTGRLRASIETDIERVGENAVLGRIGTNVEYAEHVEFGPHWPAFLHPAVENNRSFIERTFKAAASAAVREVS